MTITQQIISILLAALVTMATRFIPFLLFDRSGADLSPYLERLGKFLPAAIMGVLVVYCYRNVTIANWPQTIVAILAGVATLILQLWRHNMPLSILAGTGLYIGLLNMVS